MVTLWPCCRCSPSRRSPSSPHRRLRARQSAWEVDECCVRGSTRPPKAQTFTAAPATALTCSSHSLTRSTLPSNSPSPQTASSVLFKWKRAQVNALSCWNTYLLTDLLTTDLFYSNTISQIHSFPNQASVICAKEKKVFSRHSACATKGIERRE